MYVFQFIIPIILFKVFISINGFAVHMLCVPFQLFAYDIPGSLISDVKECKIQNCSFGNNSEG